MTTTRHHTTRAPERSARPQRTRLPSDPQGDASAFSAARRSLDRVLELFEQGQLSATEMRVLLLLLEHRDASIAELTEELGTRPTEVTRAGRRLAMRGLVRWHHGGGPEHALLEVTAAGVATIGVLLTALGQTPAARDECLPRGRPGRLNGYCEPHD
jgi:DNA-binding MarR family transcriptional regulator